MRIYLGGHLNYYHPTKAWWLEVDIKSTIPLVDILEDSGIPLGEVYLIVLNGEKVELNETLVSNQDEVRLYSAVGGG